jgi:hypothetical protein
VRRACGLNFDAGFPNTPKLTGKDGEKSRLRLKFLQKAATIQAFRIVAKQLHQGCRFDMLQMKRVFSWLP